MGNGSFLVLIFKFKNYDLLFIKMFYFLIKYNREGKYIHLLSFFNQRAKKQGQPEEAYAVAS